MFDTLDAIGLVAGLKLYANEFVGEPYEPVPPDRILRRGPYRKRRELRWRRRHPPYFRPNGSVLIARDSAFVHPGDLPRLREMIARANRSPS
jgi:hypothetical protein